MFGVGLFDATPSRPKRRLARNRVSSQAIHPVSHAYMSCDQHMLLPVIGMGKVEPTLQIDHSLLEMLIEPRDLQEMAVEPRDLQEMAIEPRNVQEMAVEPRDLQEMAIEPREFPGNGD